MLDKRTNILLNFLVSACEKGSYEVVSILDMIKVFPKKYGIDNIALQQMLTYLSERSYIDIKYSDENCYCVATLPKARIEHENTQNLQKNTKKLKKIAFFCIFFAFLFAFLGAVVGVFISKYLF